MKRYFSSIKQYSWVVLVCMILGGVVGYAMVKTSPVVYQATSTMLVQTNAPNNSISPTISAADGLSQAVNYTSEIQSREVMQYVYDNNPLIKKRGYTANDLLTDITTGTSSTAATVTITSSTANAKDAVLLANAVATSFQNYIQQQLQAQLNAETASLNAQLASYNKDKSYWEGQIESIANPTDPRVNIDQTNLQDTIHSIDAIQAQLFQLPVKVNSNIVVIQLAEPIDVQISEKGPIIEGVGAFLGLLIGILVMLLLIFLENRLRSETQVQEKLGLAYLGGLSKNKVFKESPTQLTGQSMREVAAIAANLRLTEILPGQWRVPHGAVLLVTSARNAEGKTTIAAALAACVARGGSTVAIIDGNLSQPGTHLAFDVNPSGPGLSGLLQGAAGIDDVVQRSSIPNVWLLPVGTPLEDGAFMLEQKLPMILSELRKKADLIIIDGSALLYGPEASIMAELADGVALVVDSKRDKVPVLLKSKELLSSLTDTPVGVLMNFLPRRKRDQYYVSAKKKNEAIVENWMLVSASASNGNRNGKSNGNGASYGQRQDIMGSVSPSPAGIQPPLMPAMDVSMPPNWSTAFPSTNPGEMPGANPGNTYSPKPPLSPRPDAGPGGWINPSSPKHPGRDE